MSKIKYCNIKECNQLVHLSRDKCIEHLHLEIKDPVSNPAHYTKNQIQPLDVIEDWDLPFHLANVVKYIARAPYKGAEAQDLEKAQYYLDRYIERLKNA